MSRMRAVVDSGIGDQKRRARPAGVLELHAGLMRPGETPSVTEEDERQVGIVYLD